MLRQQTSFVVRLSLHAIKRFYPINAVDIGLLRCKLNKVKEKREVIDLMVLILVIVVCCLAVYVYTSQKEKQKLNEKIEFQHSLIRDLTEGLEYLDEKQRGGFHHVS
ncbi:hypothetical protein HCA63_16980 [Listeria booriae]|uniref:Uncharacterized protein n=1 Tax=Listeria booriae TaxID=1552123 RepID=A0A7X1BW70_9LIST|nr:hypothetical protein [Listeria booriae]MBC1333503.1 hypothetical protein [Listeria booriae]MBC1890053.1 hypothetical protein [Listeria booriae]MBC2373738.1 hypothetical protein [Listeria booriae]MDT0112167.1 hypothetical protein [Listeria booriae]